MKIFEGEVLTAKNKFDAVVLVERYFRHPLYGKILRRNSKFHATNEIEAVAGDKVKIVEIRPVSKTINFKIKEISGKKEPEKKEIVTEEKSKAVKVKKTVKKVKEIK